MSSLLVYIGETIRHIIARAVLSVISDDIQCAAGSLQQGSCCSRKEKDMKQKECYWLMLLMH